MADAFRSTSADPFVDLATRAVHEIVHNGRTLPPPDPVPVPMRGRAGVFVSIKKRGQLRGCVGTFLPNEATLAHEVIANAVRSACSDPRFPAINESELDHLTVSVDVLSTPRPCSESELDPSRYGILVESGRRRGLLLPDLEGVDSVADQIAIAKSKAGIGQAEPVLLSRFTVERHS
jgi:MEMO1 family protein